MTKDEILQSLNEKQKEAALHIEGSAVVMAGAGSGKTHTIVARAQLMILDGIDPTSICMFTFTNKAANEMKERIIKATGEQGKLVTVSTYHSICNRILRKYATHIGYTKNFTILDESDKEKIIKSIAKEMGVDDKILASKISTFKSNVIIPSVAIIGAENDTERRIANGYEKYQTKLKSQMTMDFDDLLLNTVLLLRSNRTIQLELNNKWKYITIDENQDSSATDSELVRLLVGDNNNLMVVGDDFQSIYGFRQADVDLFINIRKQYPGMKLYNLKYNYRSSDVIVKGAKSLVDKNTMQVKKEVEAARGYKGSPIVVTKCKDQKDEASKAVTYIKMVHDKYKVPYSEIAILYRMSYLSRNFEEALMKAKIPYKVKSGTSFFNRMEVQDILSFIKLTINEYDVPAFKRTIQIPKRGIGEKTIEKIEEFAVSYPGGPIPIREAIEKIELKGKQGKSLKEYISFLEDLDDKKVELSPSDLITYIITELDYVSHLENTEKETYQSRIENLMELVNVAKEYDEIDELIQQASLYTSSENDEDIDKVSLITLHGSKGLEYQTIILSSCCEGILPHHRSTTSLKQLEEERRLCYVGMTRAKDYLFMLYPQSVLMQGRPTYAKPSRFLNEIDKKYIYKN